MNQSSALLFRIALLSVFRATMAGNKASPSREKAVRGDNMLKTGVTYKVKILNGVSGWLPLAKKSISILTR